MKKHFFFSAVYFFVFLFAVMSVKATVYEVKPNTPLDTIAEVPWANLQPGDTVLIYWKETAYKEKWVICRQGTADQPITVRGVPNSNGDLPIIDGNGAVTPTNLNFASEQRGVIKIGGANIPADTMPRYITIENLEIRSAHPNYQFTDDGGNTQTYTSAASSIYVEKGENIIVRNCKLHDSANGFFVASSEDTVSRSILVEGNYIFGNGIVGSAFQHNNYTAAIGIIFQYNRFGAMRSGANGNALKDRSAGTVVRYNWIEAGNRQLDLVDGEDSSQIRNAPEYRQTFVYGNLLIEPDGAGNSQIAHYGGDSGTTANYRKGTLYFYNNTLVSTRTGTTTLFRLSTNEETCDARNNIFYVTATGSNLALLDDTGVLSISHNWFKPNWRISHGTASGTIINDGTSVQGASPNFADEAAQDFRLASDSAAVDAGTNLHADALPTHNVIRQYVKHQTGETRPANGAFDIGAFEAQTASVPSYEADVAARPNGDGSILSDDVVQVRRFLNATHTPDQTTDEFQRADSAPIATLGDGKILSDDVVQARRYQNGANPKQFVGGPMTQSAGRTPIDNLVANVSTIIFENARREVRVESASGSVGQKVTVNIRVDAQSDESEYGFILSYDQTKLSNPVIGAGFAGASVRSCNRATAGQINCSIGGFPTNSPTSSDTGIGEIETGSNQILITVTFTIAANAPVGTTPLALTNVNASSDAPVLFTPTAANGTVTIPAPDCRRGRDMRARCNN